MPRISFRAWAAGLVLLSAGVAVPAGSAATRFESGPRVAQTTLGNGLRIVVVENHTVPLAQVAMWYRFGSIDDPPGRTGLAHALEHMMFRGTLALSGTALDLVTARFGIDMNAETDHEYTHYYQTGPAASVPLALRIEADRMRGLRLDPRDWRLERQAVLSELADSDWSDAGNLEDAVRSAAVGTTSPFAHDPGGSPADVRRISVRDLRNAYDTGYQPANATLVVTGDVDPATVLKLAGTLFGRIASRAPLAQPATEPIVARGFIVRRRALSNDIVDVALDARGEGAPDTSAEEIAEDLLLPSHAAFRDLLGEDGPCESYDIDDDAQLHGGVIHIVCSLRDGAKADRAVHAIRQALRELPSRVTATDIAYARRTDIAETSYTCESLTDEADLFGEYLAIVRADPRQLDLDTTRVSDAAVIAILRRWATPVGIGVATNAPPGGEYHHARKTRTEHVSPAPLEPEIAPAWARVAPRPFHTSSASHVEAFTLPNGLRVFVEPRHGDGVVYLRGGTQDADLTYPNATLERAAEQHSIEMDADSPSTMHGFARDLPIMLSFLGDFWSVREHDGEAWHHPGGTPSPQSAWIAITGDVDSDSVRANVSRAFGDWIDLAPRVSASPSRSRPRIQPGRLVSYGAPGPTVRSGFLLPAPTRGSRDFAAMMLLNTILGGDGDLDTRLSREVRTRRGLVYGVGSSYDANDGRFTIWFESTNRQFAAARTAVRDVVNEMRFGTVTSEERGRAYHKLVALALRGQASPDGVLDNLADAANNHRTPDDVESLAALYGAVSLDDIHRLAAKELRLDQATEVVKGRGP